MREQQRARNQRPNFLAATRGSKRSERTQFAQVARSEAGGSWCHSSPGKSRAEFTKNWIPGEDLNLDKQSQSLWSYR